MNGAAAHRSLSAKSHSTAIPREFVGSGTTRLHSESRRRARGRSFVRGLPVQITYALIDAILVYSSGLAAIWFRFGVWLPTTLGMEVFTRSTQHFYKGFFLLYAIFVVMGCLSQNLYRTPRDRSDLDESLMVAKAVTVATTVLVLFIFVSGIKDISRVVVVSAGALNVVLLSSWRYFKRRLVLRRVAAGIGVSRVLIVGAGNMGIALGRWLDSNPQLGYHVCGYLDDRPSSDPRILGPLDDLRKAAIMQFADELFVTPPSESQLVEKLALLAHELRLGLKIFPDLYDGLGWSAPLHMIGGFPVMDLHWQPIPKMGLVIKRITDIVFAGLALILTSPLLALLALCVQLDSSGPPIYAAERIGLKGKRFRCYKLRSMVASADLQKNALRLMNERSGPFFKLENDPRVTRIGKWLRKTSLDELPQLWNVLCGDMSLVGPRPHPVDDYQYYSIEHLRRLDVTPGLTGLWQVSARSDPSFEKNMALDLEYIEHWSLGLDLRILLRTIPAVFRAEGR